MVRPAPLSSPWPVSRAWPLSGPWRLSGPWPLIGLWALLTLVALWARPLAPVDETRYASVAWDMWLSSDWLLPHLNGTAYPDKPPLLFWLVNLSWLLAGPSDWAARAVPALATLLDLWLLHRLERLLWPQDSDRPALSPWIFYGSVLVAPFGTALMFDLLLTTSVLLALIGLAGAARREGIGNWALYAVGLGLGTLTKGPVILMYLLPVALLAPWWLPAPRRGWWHWYGPLTVAVLAGAGLALCWAIPAARRGGAGYAEAIFLGQTAGRMVRAFQHARPWYWYLVLLPVILLPWSLWPPLWRALAGLGRQSGSSERFCLAWLLPGLVGFSAISGKQAHYLIPLLPAFALLAARALSRASPRPGGWGAPTLAVLPWVGLGLAIATAPVLTTVLPSHPSTAASAVPYWFARLSPAWGLALAALALGFVPLLRSRGFLQGVAALPRVARPLLHAGPVRDIVSPAYDARPLARKIAALRADGILVAYPGKYHGDFQFAGRLRQPLAQFWPGTEVSWARAHPQAVLLLNYKTLSEEQRAAAVLAVPYQNGETALWQATTLITHPEYAAGALTANEPMRGSPE